MEMLNQEETFILNTRVWFLADRGWAEWMEIVSKGSDAPGVVLNRN